jgi:hypothetical protein
MHNPNLDVPERSTGRRWYSDKEKLCGDNVDDPYISVRIYPPSMDIHRFIHHPWIFIRIHPDTPSADRELHFISRNFVDAEIAAVLSRISGRRLQLAG